MNGVKSADVWSCRWLSSRVLFSYMQICEDFWQFARRSAQATRAGSVRFNATPEERAFFITMRPSMSQGFGGTFNQLDQYLAELKGAK